MPGFAPGWGIVLTGLQGIPLRSAAWKTRRLASVNRGRSRETPRRAILWWMNQPIQLPDKDPALRVTPMPADVNVHGDVFGGWIMSQADIAGAIVAARRARGRVVTVAVNQFVFKHPVAVGDLVSFYGDVTHVGTTSITIEVEVFAQRRPEDIEVYRVTEASFTYVAVDANGCKREIPTP